MGRECNTSAKNTNLSDKRKKMPRNLATWSGTGPMLGHTAIARQHSQHGSHDGCRWFLTWVFSVTLSCNFACWIDILRKIDHQSPNRSFVRTMWLNY
eukprot:898839-Amphidinium_carterae.1